MSKAKPQSKGGVQTILAFDGRVWRRGDFGEWIWEEGADVYAIEKRVRCPEKGVEDTGWYLTDNRAGGFLGEWCAPPLLDAVDAATILMRKPGNQYV